MGIPQNGFLSVYLKINSIVDVIRSSSEKFLLVDDFFIYMTIEMSKRWVSLKTASSLFI